MRPYVLLSVPVLAAAVLAACDTRHPIAPSLTPLEARGVPGGQELAAPSNVTATAVSTTQIDVTWQDNTTNETSFEVRRTVGGTSVIVTTTGANVVSFSDGGLASGVEHCYEVRAARVLGANTAYSAFSNSACATTLVPPPPPPPPPPSPPAAVTNVKATPDGGVNVTWSADNTTAASFRIERSGDGGAPWVVVGTQDAYYSVLAFFDSPLVAEQQVCYRVIAVNAGGDSPPSNISCTTPPAGTTLTGTLIDAQTLELRWSDNSAVEDGFEIYLHIYRGSMQCCPKAPDGSSLCDSGVYDVTWPVAQVPPNVTAYRLEAIAADTVCGPPTTYSYFILVMKDGGGSLSNEVSATTGEPAGAAASLISATTSQSPTRVVPSVSFAIRQFNTSTQNTDGRLRSRFPGRPGHRGTTPAADHRRRRRSPSRTRKVVAEGNRRASR